jgi:HAD superfamily hydrolase (TIGR01509 family)
MPSPLKYDAYIFDLDGTLTDASIPISHGLIRALDTVGINGIKPQDTLLWIGRPLSEIFDSYLLHHQNRTADAETFAYMVQAYREGHDELFPDEVRIYPDVFETLQRLRDSRAAIAIATTKYQEAAEFVAAGMKLDAAVDVVCGTDPDKPVKPDPFVINRALERLKADPSRTLVIGDTDADIIAAHAAGCHGAAVTFGFGNQEEIKRTRPEYLIDSLNQLP